MKKRFTLMMMVLCFLMSIPLKMMAETVTVHFIDEDKWSDNGGKICAYVYKGNAFLIKKWPGTECNDIQIVGGKKVATWTLNLGDGVAASEAGIVFNNNKGSQYPANGVFWQIKDGLYYYPNGKTSTTPPSEGGDSGSGTTSPTISVKSNYGQDWGVNNKFNFSSTDGKIYTCELKDVPANETVCFRIVKNDKEWGPNSGSNLVLTSEYQTIYQVDNSANYLQIGPSTVQSTYTITYDSENNQIKCTTTSGSTTIDWNTVNTNRLTGKKYTQGFYLAGDFFTFDTDGINYDDAVFKFQQQKSINEIAETAYDVYMVEIPASLDAHAQVMYVDKTGTAKKLFFPLSACGISETYPKTANSTNWETLISSEELPENNKYWNFTSRNKTASEYSDGLYEVYIAVDNNTHEPAKWMIKHQAKKRVAYFISDAPDATAIPLYDAYKKNQDQFGNKFFATVDLAANRSYYVISNYVRDNQYVGDNQYASLKESLKNYKVTAPSGDIISCPTTNKLFLLGNAAKDIALADDKNQFNQFSPNEKPMPGARSGKNQSVAIVEYNPSNGKNESAILDKHLGIRGQVMVRNDRKELTSVSLVGDAIPGTLNADGTWNYKSNVADMTFDETELCYKATVVTTVADDGNSKFRFVGNRDPQITWFENTKDDEKEMAKHPYDSKSAPGHTADANDPNQVNYTQDGVNPEEDWNIIWNRPAGRWTVRLYFYTYSDGNDPKTDYYYTITANRDMELHDVKDVVYGSSDNKQNITNLGGYKFMRTWSAQKAWKISNKVDIFVVSSITDDKSGVVKMTLTNINEYVSHEDRVIPANTGVILATKYDASDIPGAQFKSRQDFTSYNNLLIPMEQYEDVEYPKDKNRLEPILTSRVIPSSDKDNYNYFFGYYNTQIATGDKIHHEANDYLLGFWISKGSKPYPSNSSYLPIPKDKAATMNRLGTIYDDFKSDGKAKKVPGVIFDFDNVGGTTGINEVANQSTKLNDGKYYTLSGQQVEKPTAGGIYIHNGRKFVVK